MIEISKGKLKIKDIIVKSSSYSNRTIEVNIEYFSPYINEYDTFEFYIIGNSFSCGINFLSESDRLIRCLAVMKENPETIITFFKKIINELDLNKEKYEGFSSKEIPSIYIMSTTSMNYNINKKYYNELKKIALNSDFFENFTFNRNSGNYINVMMLSTNKILSKIK